MDSLKIINKIIDKGGYIGACAKMYINDEEKTSRFLKECYGQFHTPLAKNYWGEELINEITEYLETNENQVFT